ncbi:putative short-chain dehydrogenase/reductase family protein [Xylaria arbuscula]|nr:putative short-chain dehydrogenase/reductase family protein [Xylaria arbuscula]
MVPPILQYFHSHLILKLPYPSKSFGGSTIIVTGANSGLGLEAALILAVRNLEKGNAAKDSIIASTGKETTIEVWELDLASRASVEAFAARANKLERLDIVVQNAGVLTHDFILVEGHEQMITVNVINTFYLAFLLLPKLRNTSTRLNKEVVLTFTGSLTHWLAAFPERNSANVLGQLANKDEADMRQRYVLSKLLELLAFRELSDAVAQSSSKPGDVVISMANPGSVITNLDREGQGLRGRIWSAYVRVVGRTAEEGSRTIVHAAEGGRNTHGQYLDDCQIGRVSDFVNSKEGHDAQKKFMGGAYDTAGRKTARNHAKSLISCSVPFINKLP